MQARIAISLIILLSTILLVWGAQPGVIDPQAWRPPGAPAAMGVLAPNQRLQRAELLGLGRIRGPEDVAVDAHGRVYGGMLDGSIRRIDLHDQVTVFAHTGGRPLGLAFEHSGNLIVADAVKGLLSIDPAGHVSTLVTAVDGVPLGFTDDVDIAGDGMIYFSDASTRFAVRDLMLDLLIARPYGRLLRYDPRDGSTRVMLDHLYFANGVAVAGDDAFVLVNETWRFRIRRLWLKGSKAGQADIFADNLPGFPDGVSSNRQGRFWVAFPAPRNAFMDFISPHPWMKNLLTRLPQAWWPKAPKHGLVLSLDRSGRIIESLQDPSGEHLQEITSVEEVDGALYFGSLHNDRIGRLDL